MNKTRILTVLAVATFLLTLTATRVFADQIYSFHVTNSQGSPISGATIWIQGSEGSVTIPYQGQTDANGNAQIPIPSGVTVTSYAVQESGYDTASGNNPSTSTNVQLSPVGSSSSNPSPGPTQWNSSSIEIGIVWVFVLLIILILFERGKGKKKEK